MTDEESKALEELREATIELVRIDAEQSNMIPPSTKPIHEGGGQGVWLNEDWFERWKRLEEQRKAAEEKRRKALENLYAARGRGDP